MPIKFYSWLKKTALILPVMLLAFNAQMQAQPCTWLPYAPYITQPVYKYYVNQLGTNGIYIARCSTDKAIINFDNQSTYPPATDTNNYNYFGGPGGKLCKANAGSNVDFWIQTAYLLGTSSTSLPQLNLYIDWNHNGVFEDGTNYTERVAFLSTPAPTNGSVSGILTSGGTGGAKFTFTVPKSAKNGLTRMRVRLGALGVAGVGSTLGPGYTYGCSQTGHGETEDYDFEIVNPCLPPSVISVSNIRCDGAEICWSGVDNADLYDYWVDTCITAGCAIDPLLIPPPTIYYFGYPLSNATCRTVPNPIYNTILPETKYYVTVRATCDTIQKPTSQYWQNSTWISDSFTTLACCRNPTNVKVTEPTSNTAKATWDAVHTAYSYEYAVTTTPNNPPATGTKITSTSLLLQGLTHSKTYYFCVRALCNPTPTSGWECFPFSTQNTTSIASYGVDAPELTAYPNPVKNIVTVAVENFNKAGVVTVSDIAGRVVHTVAMTTGKTDINMGNWAQGIYLVRYTSEAGTKTIMITKE